MKTLPSWMLYRIDTQCNTLHRNGGAFYSYINRCALCTTYLCTTYLGRMFCTIYKEKCYHRKCINSYILTSEYFYILILTFTYDLVQLNLYIIIISKIRDVSTIFSQSYIRSSIYKDEPKHYWSYEWVWKNRISKEHGLYHYNILVSS